MAINGDLSHSGQHGNASRFHLHSTSTEAGRPFDRKEGEPTRNKKGPPGQPPWHSVRRGPSQQGRQAHESIRVSVRRGGHQVSGRHNGDGGREPTLICPRAVLGGQWPSPQKRNGGALHQ